MKVKPEQESLHILVTDTNHHVRDFLKRELEKEGFTVACAGSGIEAYNLICAATSLDAVILDPELLSVNTRLPLKKLLEQKASIQILIHAYDDVSLGLKPGDNIHIVPKSASSIGSIKDTIKTRCTAKAGS